MASQTEPCCPACGAHDTGTPLAVYSIAKAAAHFCPPTRDADRNARLAHTIDRLWNGHPATIYRCAECTFAFASPFVGGNEDFYDILHEQQGYPAWRWDYDVAMSSAIAPRGAGRVLDIGAGTGMFLRGLDHRWQKFATEGGESTRVQLEAHGIRVSRDLGALTAAEPGSFDVITMFQFLEHIAEFRPLLAQCRTLLKRGGRIVITVPHGDAMLRQERLLGAPDMPPFHVNKWTPESLARVLRDTGFEVDATLPCPAGWRDLVGALHLRVLADSTARGTLASLAYRIKRKSLRVPLLAALGVPALIRLLPKLRELRMPGTFAMIGSAGDARPAA